MLRDLQNAVQRRDHQEGWDRTFTPPVESMRWLGDFLQGHSWAEDYASSLAMTIFEVGVCVRSTSVPKKKQRENVSNDYYFYSSTTLHMFYLTLLWTRQVDLASSYKTVPFCEVAADICDRTLDLNVHWWGVMVCLACRDRFGTPALLSM